MTYIQAGKATVDPRDDNAATAGEEQPCVLVVDDDPAVRKILHDILIRNRCHVMMADGGRSALELASLGTYDVIITDIFMPDYDGFELIRDLRRDKNPIGIVAISSGGTRYNLHDMLNVATALGADIAVSKPFGIADVLEAVRFASARARERIPS